MAVKTLRITLFIVPVFSVSACALSVPKHYAPLSSYTLVLESSQADGGPATNYCYADLDQGVIYTLADAQVNDTKVDFKYSCTVAPANYTRVLQPMFKPYFPELNNITTSYILSADSLGITDALFEAIRTADDINNYFNARGFQSTPGLHGYITDSPGDRVMENIFAFTTNGGTKKGFLKIEPYAPQPAAGSKATIVIRVKIQP